MYAVTRPFDRTIAAGAGAVVAAATCLAVALLMLVSSMMLARLGIDYEVSGGSPLSKIHPATYATVFAFVLFLVARLDLFALLDDLIRRHWGTLVFAVTVMILLVQATLVLRVPAAGIIDTFILPILIFILLTRLTPGTLGRLGLMIHAVMAANAALALIELGTGLRLTPLVAAGVPLDGDWRSSALLGHPLANAIVTGAYLLILLSVGWRDLPRGLTALMVLLQVGAMVAFSGRAATVLLILFAIPAAFGAGMAGRGPRRIGMVEAAIALVVLGVAVVAALILATTGFFDRFLERFVDDQGSAETRLAMFSLLARIPLHELFFGPSPELVSTLQRLEGVEFGIESFWVAMFAYYGILASLPLFLGLLLFLLRDVRRAALPASIWTILYVIAVASTSASFSGKTTSLALLVAMVLVLARRPPNPRRAG